MRQNLLKIKSFKYSTLIIKINRQLEKDHHEFVLSKQILKSGTAVGALIRESEYAQSKLDFINKLSIGLKECNESLYWLELLEDANMITKADFAFVHGLGEELRKILSSSIITTKKSIKKNVSNQ